MIIPFPSIRTQLMLVALIVLILPWVGISTLRDMEQLLRHQQVEAATLSATTIREGLGSTLQILTEHHQQLAASPKNSEITLSSFDSPIKIDGYADDWPKNVVEQSFNARQHLLDGKPDTNIEYRLISGYQQGELLLLFDVTDDRLFQEYQAAVLDGNADHLQIAFPDNFGRQHHYMLASHSPGWLSVIPMNNGPNESHRIRAELQVKPGGYVVEVAIPISMLSGKLSLNLYDYDSHDASRFSVLGNTSIDQQESYGLLLSRESRLTQSILPYQSIHRRILLVNARGNVLADVGKAEPSVAIDEPGLLQRLYRLVVIANSLVIEEPGNNFRHYDTYVLAALKGDASNQFMHYENGTEQLGIALPIVDNNQQIGAVVLIESTQVISDIRRKAIMHIFVMSSLAILIIVTLLLLYAGLLIRRIRRLNQQLQNTVSDDGLLQGKLKQSFLGDEVGDLNRGLVKIVDRLQGYQQYMQTMAAKLSHELRTPLTVVQSSLENLQQEDDVERQQELILRANEGLSRLRLILSNLTEATRLENSINDIDTEAVDLVALVKGCVQSYSQAYPDANLEFSSECDQFSIQGSPELLAQLLDKLINNAVDFHMTDTAIEVALKLEKQGGLKFSVSNHGPALPDHLSGSLFDSMVSQREARDDVPHLGLGLYVARLIAEYHQATISGASRNGKATFEVLFRPESGRPSKKAS